MSLILVNFIIIDLYCKGWITYIVYVYVMCAPFIPINWINFPSFFVRKKNKNSNENYSISICSNT